MAMVQYLIPILIPGIFFEVQKNTSKASPFSFHPPTPLGLPPTPLGLGIARCFPFHHQGKDNQLALHGFGAKMSPEVWVKAIANLGTEAPAFLQQQRFTEDATPGYMADDVEGCH